MADQHNFSLSKDNLVVAAFGDPQSITYDNLIKTQVLPGYNRAMSLNPDLMIIAGDMNEHGENPWHWDTLESVLKQANIPYEAPNTFFYPVHGDHDLIGLSAMDSLTKEADWKQRWTDRLDLPGNETFYTFRRNNVQFIAVSFPTMPLPRFSRADVQYPWLVQQFQAAWANPEIDWIYVYYHDPLQISWWNFGTLFTDYGVNILHHGDKHSSYISHPLLFNPSTPYDPAVTNEPGKGSLVFEAVVGGWLGRADGYDADIKVRACTIMKLEFIGKTVKGWCVNIPDGKVLFTWSRISLRNGTVTFDSLSTTPVTPAVTTNTSTQLKVLAHFSDATTTDITDTMFCTFTSLDPAVATVTPGGLIAGVAEGSTQIVVKSKFDKAGTYNFDKYDTVDVAVIPASVSGTVPVITGTFYLGCFPNPSKGAVSIQWKMSEKDRGLLSIYSVTGKQVHKTSLQEYQGSYSWKGAPTGGIYFVRLESAGQSRTKKVLITK
jgi:hypothetical protein